MKMVPFLGGRLVTGNLPTDNPKSLDGIAFQEHFTALTGVPSGKGVSL